jgi:phage gp29-like protein
MSIVDHLGRPVSTAELKEEQAVVDGQQRTHRLETIESMTPARLREVILAAEEGDLDALVAYTDSVLRLDGHIGSVVRKRRLALANRDWTVKAAGDDVTSVKHADAIRDLIQQPQWRQLVGAMQSAVVYPFAPIEILWATDGGMWWPRAFELRDLRWMEIVPDDPTPIKLWSKTGTEELRPYGWVLHQSGQFDGPPWRDGLARCLCVLRLLKSLAVRSWAELAEIFGIPLRMGTYGKGATKEEQLSLKKALRAIGLDGIGIFPAGMKIELLDAPTATADFHERLVDWLDRQASKAVGNETMTSDNGSSRAQSEVHNEVRLEVVAFDAGRSGATVARDVVRALIDLNFGPQKRYPQAICDTEDPAELETWVGSVAEMVDRGLEVEASGVRDRLGLPEPADGAELLRPAGKGEGPEPFTRRRRKPKGPPATHAEAEERDAVDDQVDQVDLDAVAAEWSKPIGEAADQASSYDDFKKRLKKMKLTPQTTVAELAGKMLALRGLGDATDEVDP